MDDIFTLSGEIFLLSGGKNLLPTECEMRILLKKSTLFLNNPRIKWFLRSNSRPNRVNRYRCRFFFWRGLIKKLQSGVIGHGRSGNQKQTCFFFRPDPTMPLKIASQFGIKFITKNMTLNSHKKGININGLARALGF